MSSVMNNTYKCAANLEMMEADGEFLILDTDQLTITKLNAMGGTLWSFLQQNMELEHILSAIQEEYETDSANVRHDVTAFLNELHGMGLVEFGTVR